jgi:signal transduction histidine kinase
MLADLARMEQMVTQILESARLERGRVDLKSEPLQLAGAVQHVITQLEERARTEHISITTDIAPALTVVSDPLALDVVVRNVLENALAAVKGAGGGRINLSARGTEREVELQVADSGVGFTPGEGARLFHKFSRLHGSAHYGTGLGLYIVRRLMEMADGRVSAQSDGIGQGARVRLTWPAAAAGAAPQPAHRREQTPS